MRARIEINGQELEVRSYAPGDGTLAYTITDPAEDRSTGLPVTMDQAQLVTPKGWHVEQRPGQLVGVKDSPKQ